MRTVRDDGTKYFSHKDIASLFLEPTNNADGLEDLTEHLEEDPDEEISTSIQRKDKIIRIEPAMKHFGPISPPQSTELPEKKIMLRPPRLGQEIPLQFSEMNALSLIKDEISQEIRRLENPTLEQGQELQKLLTEQKKKEDAKQYREAIQLGETILLLAKKMANKNIAEARIEAKKISKKDEINEKMKAITEILQKGILTKYQIEQIKYLLNHTLATYNRGDIEQAQDLANQAYNLTISAEKILKAAPIHRNELTQAQQPKKGFFSRVKSFLSFGKT